MGILKRVSAGFSMLVVGLALAACGGSTQATGEDAVDVSEALILPYTAINLGAGTVRFAVTLPSGQHYVEIFARKNGVQNVAHKILTSGVVKGDGTTTYSYEKSGYALGDNIEYRFYSYIGPGVFTPGPAQNVWASYTYGAPVTFKTSGGNYLLANQLDASGRSFSYQIETSTGKTYVTPFSTGWVMTKASPSSTQVEAAVEADYVGTFVKKAGSDVYDPVALYDQYTITATQYSYLLDIAVEPDTSIYPGTFVDSSYAEGGHSVTIQTIIGPKTMTTDATVTFAHLIKQKTWSGQ